MTSHLRTRHLLVTKSFKSVRSKYLQYLTYLMSINPMHILIFRRNEPILDGVLSFNEFP